MENTHSRPQRPRSFWSAPGIETSGRLQNRKSAIHGLIVKYDKSDWLKNTERVLCACSEIGSCQRSRILVPRATRFICADTKRRALGTRMEVSIPGADQKDRGLWGREWKLPCLDTKVGNAKPFTSSGF